MKFVNVKAKPEVTGSRLAASLAPSHSYRSTKARANEITLSEISLHNLKRVRTSHIALSATLGFIAAHLLIGSNLLALPFAAIASCVPTLIAKRRVERKQLLLGALWPELLDHMISGLRSGLSIAETLSGLSTRGPEISRPIFLRCKKLLLSGADITLVFTLIKNEFNDPVADQVCEVLDFARGTGSRDTAITLRTLGDFIRSDIAVRGEIRAKLGWVKNSALVAAIAPWILLIILSSQPSTLQAFATGTGNLILLFGVGMSAVAYFWMSRVGRVQETPRIFHGAPVSSSTSNFGGEPT